MTHERDLLPVDHLLIVQVDYVLCHHGKRHILGMWTVPVVAGIDINNFPLRRPINDLYTKINYMIKTRHFFVKLLR